MLLMYVFVKYNVSINILGTNNLITSYERLNNFLWMIDDIGATAE